MSKIKNSFWDEILEKGDVEQGAVCSVCHKPLDDIYMHPVACSECGGKAELNEEEIEMILSDNDQFGVGA